MPTPYYLIETADLEGNPGVPGWGYLAICVDTENNTFGLWEEDSCNRLRIGSKEGLDGCKGIKPSQSPTCVTYNT